MDHGEALHRAQELLADMTAEEKIYQLRSQLLFMDEYYEKRDYRIANIRNVGHFMHRSPVDPKPSEVAAKINEDTKRTMEASPHGIPALQHGEALHGACWGNNTCFPQCIGLAAAFDDGLISDVSAAISQELRAVGVRLVYTPVINIARDCRWGRTEETFGEDVCLSSRYAAAYCRAMTDRGIAACAKHFVDNYADGGRDSNASCRSWRDLREVYLEPFRAAFTEGGARAVMMSYNSVDGVPAACSKKLMSGILRSEWGFEGVTVSDYSGVDGISGAHALAATRAEGEALALRAGLDIDLPNGYQNLREALDKGLVSESDIDAAALRVLTLKFELGLFDEPFVDSAAADDKVRTPSHKAVALRAAEESLVLLKNDGSLLPLDKKKIKTIGVFGATAFRANLGGYSGPYGGWHGPDALSPLEALREYAPDMRVVTDTARAGECDILLYFTSNLEGEGSDRCSLKLPACGRTDFDDSGNAVIIDDDDREVTEDQQAAIAALAGTGVPLAVIMINGSPVDVTDWEPLVPAILEAWYPGEQGSRAIVEALFGSYCPGGRLPLTFPRSIGQEPLYYAQKPSGRGSGYIENDGSPMWPFGFGLSYTTFETSDFELSAGEGEIATAVTFTVTNTGSFAGDDVLQLYLLSEHCRVVRPERELKDYARVHLVPGEKKSVSLRLKKRDLCYYDEDMNFGPHGGDYTLIVADNAGAGAKQSFAVKSE